jgi:hypothetical protein
LVPGGVTDLEAIGRIQKFLERHACDACGLGSVDDAHGAGVPPVRQDRYDVELRWRHVDTGHRCERLHACRVESGLLLRFAQRGGDGRFVSGISGATGECDLSTVLTQRGCALCQKDVGVGR